MANLGTWKINTHGIHIKLSEVEAVNLLTNQTQTGINLEAGATFLFNIENFCRLRVGTQGLGIPITSPEGFTYTDDGENDLYIQTTEAGCIVNIAK